MCCTLLMYSFLERLFHPFGVGGLFSLLTRGVALLHPWLLEWHPFRMRAAPKMHRPMHRRCDGRVIGCGVVRPAGGIG